MSVRAFWRKKTKTESRPNYFQTGRVLAKKINIFAKIMGGGSKSVCEVRVFWTGFQGEKSIGGGIWGGAKIVLTFFHKFFPNPRNLTKIFFLGLWGCFPRPGALRARFVSKSRFFEIFDQKIPGRTFLEQSLVLYKWKICKITFMHLLSRF